MARSGWAALVATVLLVAGLGSEPALDAAGDADRQVAPLLQSLTTFPAWSASALGFDSDMYTAIAVKIVVLLVLVFVLARAAGHVGASFAAFLAGWGALMVAAAVAGVAYVLVADMAVLDGQLADSQGGAGAVVVDGLNRGVVFGLYTGWLVGVVVVFTARPGGLQAAGGWRASPPSRTLPVPPTGAVAAAADPMADMNLVPGMPSVPSSGRAVGREPDPWVQPGPQQPVAPGAEDPWGPQPLSDPAVRSAPASGPWAAQLQSTADAAAGRGAMPDPGPWGAPPPDPQASTEGQPFVPPGSWPRPVDGTVGAAPTTENPAVPAGSWPPSSPPEPPAAPAGPIVPSGSWPPSSREHQPTNGSVSPPSYEQPEYSGLAPRRPVDPAPPSQHAGPASAAGPSGHGGAGAGADPEASEPARPLWPSAWPASSGGAYADQQDVYTADQVKRLSAEETAENGGRTDREPAAEDDPDGTGDQPDGANTRFW